MKQGDILRRVKNHLKETYKCNHKFIIKEEYIAEDSFLFKIRFRKVIVLQCKKCGIIETRQIFLGENAHKTGGLKWEL